MHMNKPIGTAVIEFSDDRCVYRRAPLTTSFIEFRKDEVEQSIPERFEHIVGKYPSHLAIKHGDYALTYTELNTLANRIAHAILRHQGSGSAPVALLFENGAALLACILGVLKSGNFFALLDPSFPVSRITAVLEDSQAVLVLVSREHLSLGQELASRKCQLMELESIDGFVAGENPGLHITPQMPAAIVHTSGSTGAPKGVVQTHRSILHDMRLRTNAYSICQNDRLTLLSSGTSSAINNSFLALLNGAALLPFDVHKEGVVGLRAWISDERVTVCWMSSPLFRRFSETLSGKEKFPDLRLIRLASDSVYKADVDLYKKYFSRTCMLANGIAPTETGLLTTCFIDHQTQLDGNEVPLGYAAEDKEIILFDNLGKAVGFNQLGEIAVRSEYLSLGYWQKPDLTRTKFIFDPKDAQCATYLTGDLGVMRTDGCLIYKGRKDFRVKIRGYGVEITEVETALKVHCGVRESIVIGRENELGETYLVAYFTAAPDVCPTIGQLRAFLAETLPEYMIPSVFVKLDVLPIAPNGKIDRRSLPAPDNFRLLPDTPFVKPRTDVEKQIAKIWMEVLGRDPVGLKDSFFDLGGDSLMATQILSRLRSVFHVDVPLSTFFDKPIIAELAQEITDAKGRES
jgi:amino acid adenylation domain-containing protein